MRHNNPDIYDIESDAPDRREFFFLGNPALALLKAWLLHESRCHQEKALGRQVNLHSSSREELP
jgi:hypothetical protein